MGLDLNKWNRDAVIQWLEPGAVKEFQPNRRCPCTRVVCSRNAYSRCRCAAG